jgi:hypothetical protein
MADRSWFKATVEDAIENPKGSTRSGSSLTGERWLAGSSPTTATSSAPRARSADRRPTRRVIKFGTDPSIPSDAPVFVIDQYNDDGEFDESLIRLRGRSAGGGGL